VDDEFQFALSRTDPSKELETYFVISNFLAKLKLIINNPITTILGRNEEKCTSLISVASFTLPLIILYHKVQQP